MCGCCAGPRGKGITVYQKYYSEKRENFQKKPRKVWLVLFAVSMLNSSECTLFPYPVNRTDQRVWLGFADTAQGVRPRAERPVNAEGHWTVWAWGSSAVWTWDSTIWTIRLKSGLRVEFSNCPSIETGTEVVASLLVRFSDFDVKTAAGLSNAYRQPRRELR